MKSTTTTPNFSKRGGGGAGGVGAKVGGSDKNVCRRKGVTACFKKNFQILKFEIENPPFFPIFVNRD
jgi:hypothetical protein